MKYQDLSIRDKAAVIRAAVRGGITNLQEIESNWNSFSEGGQQSHLFDGVTEPTQQLWTEWMNDKIPGDNRPYVTQIVDTGQVLQGSANKDALTHKPMIQYRYYTGNIDDFYADNNNNWSYEKKEGVEPISTRRVNVYSYDQNSLSGKQQKGEGANGQIRHWETQYLYPAPAPTTITETRQVSGMTPFQEAFKAALTEGKQTFMHNGQEFTTEMSGRPDVRNTVQEQRTKTTTPGGTITTTPWVPVASATVPQPQYALNRMGFGGYRFDGGGQTQVYDDTEPRNRQAFAESRFNSDAVSKANAIGLFQIQPITLQEYNDKNGTSYTEQDLRNSEVSAKIRDWYMDSLSKREFATKGGASDSITAAKAYAAYNMGPQKLVRYLNDAKAKGIDIYGNGDDKWGWLKELPKETEDYVNFILRGKNVGPVKNDFVYGIFNNIIRPNSVPADKHSTGGPQYPFSFVKGVLPEVRYDDGGTLFEDGGGIHIKPENRGKFTALKERTGHSATWFKENGTPAQRKMATFALNARKWKHDDGGSLFTELPF